MATFPANDPPAVLPAEIILAPVHPAEIRFGTGDTVVGFA
jgi:hypothetical protein